MRRATKAAPLLVLPFLFLAVPLLWASWINGGLPICTAPETQNECQIAPDGEGGAIIVWEDHRDIDLSIYKLIAQRIGASGKALWATDGALFVGRSADLNAHQIIPDGVGGVIVAWEDNVAGNTDIYAGRWGPSGSRLWGYFPVCTAVFDQRKPQLISDGAGGAIIVWSDNRIGGTDIYAQRITSGGAPVWAADGIPISRASNSQQRPDLVSDGVGGAIILWEDNRSGDLDIYAQRIDATGSVLWTVNGGPVCAAANDQRNPRITPDGVGGAIMSWEDERSGILDIYAQRIDAFGAAQWASNGIPVCTATGSQGVPRLVPDGAGGAVIGWLDARNNYPPDIGVFAQRFNASGSTQWATNGVPLCLATVDTTDLEDLRLTSDGAGGAIATWADRRGGDADVYVQRIDASGVVQWPVNGVALCTTPGRQELPRIISDGAGGAIVPWQDHRSGEYDIYVQQIDEQGRIGYLLPDIHSVDDVPGDEGGFVNLTWDAPRTDYLSGEITEYTAWRALETPTALGMLTSGAAVVSGLEELKQARESAGVKILRLATTMGATLYWELIDTQAAYRLQGYARAVPTLFDSTATYDGDHYFQVIAHTSDPSEFYVSEPDTGYSVDNLSPAQPQGLAGEQVASPPGLTLSWFPNAELDLGNYVVYRGSSADFTPGPGNLIGTPASTSQFDSEWRWYNNYYYKVSAMDVHGNESAPTLLGPETVTGIGDSKIPATTYLSQNFPNPFNPTTTITFGLESPKDVSLRIFDVSGKLVRTLVDGKREAGHFVEAWDGRDNVGVPVASGVYFYSLTAGSFEKTRKMVSLK